MLNKISCSARQLSLLQPEMIQAVVKSTAFKMGSQYAAENRVRISNADDMQISSSVIGVSGLHEQTIRLKDGSLTTKCSCALDEHPICRHCVAVLLEYQRWDPARGVAATRDKKQKPEVVVVEPEPPASTDIKFSEIAIFIDWLRPMLAAAARGEVLPEAPRMGSGEVLRWIQTLVRMAETQRGSDARQRVLEAELASSAAQLESMSQLVRTSAQEAREAQSACHNMQADLDRYRGMLAPISEVTDKLERCDSQVKGIAAELLAKGSQLEALTASFREMTGALQVVTRPQPRS